MNLMVDGEEQVPLRIEAISNQAVPELDHGLTSLQLVSKECWSPPYVRRSAPQPDAPWVLLIPLCDLPLSILADPLGLDFSVYRVLKWAIIAGPIFRFTRHEANSKSSARQASRMVPSHPLGNSVAGAGHGNANRLLGVGMCFGTELALPRSWSDGWAEV